MMISAERMISCVNKDSEVWNIHFLAHFRDANGTPFPSTLLRAWTWILIKKPTRGTARTPLIFSLRLLL